MFKKFKIRYLKSYPIKKHDLQWLDMWPDVISIALTLYHDVSKLQMKYSTSNGKPQSSLIKLQWPYCRPVPMLSCQIYIKETDNIQPYRILLNHMNYIPTDNFISIALSIMHLHLKWKLYLFSWMMDYFARYSKQNNPTGYKWVARKYYEKGFNSMRPSDTYFRQ